MSQIKKKSTNIVLSEINFQLELEANPKFLLVILPIFFENENKTTY